MKKRIIILGSTGSIGSSTLNIIKRNLSNFSITLLTANKNYKKLIIQAKKFNAENVIIKDKKYYNYIKTELKNYRTKVYCGDISLQKIIKKKVDYTISAIVGIAGLNYTIEVLKITKILAIANKESIVCAWDIIYNLSLKYKTKILPVDSEHFSIFNLTKDVKDKDIEEVLITASGGPFLNKSSKTLKSITPSQAIKHPNWKMGKKISVDSANLMNKFFELIEATKLFQINPKKYKIIIHPQSYVHSIIRFKNGLIKMILYNTNMEIPISNTIYGFKSDFSNIKNIDIEKLNQLTFKKVNIKKFPSIKLLNKCFKIGKLAPIMINAANEELVSLFLKNKIKFLDIVNNLLKLVEDKEFKKISYEKVKNVEDIYLYDNWARLKIHNISVK